MNETNESQLKAWVQHLVELRTRLLHCVMAIGMVSVLMLYFCNTLFELLALPLIRQLGSEQTLIATHIATPLVTPLKWSLIVSVFVCMPYLLFQAWQFVVPGLYQTERRFGFLILIMSVSLFYLGMLFAYIVVFPMMFHFFLKVAPSMVTVMPDISEYLNFTLRLLFAFGIAFQVPVVLFLCLRVGLFTIQQCRQARPYVIVAAFTVGMLLTPPDVLSQVLLAIPMWGLFELALFFGQRFVKKEVSHA